MAISCLGFNTIALFSRQIFKIDDAPVNASLIFWFCFAEMICSVPRNSPMGDYQNIWLIGPRPCRRFFKLLPPQSPRGFSALARLNYLARPTKTAMLRRLVPPGFHLPLSYCKLKNLLLYKMCCLIHILWKPSFLKLFFRCSQIGKLFYIWTKIINIGPFFLTENCASKMFITWSHQPFQLVFGLAYIYIFIQLYHIHKLWREINKNKLWVCYRGQNWPDTQGFHNPGQFNFPG